MSPPTQKLKVTSHPVSMATLDVVDIHSYILSFSMSTTCEVPDIVLGPPPHIVSDNVYYVYFGAHALYSAQPRKGPPPRIQSPANLEKRSGSKLESQDENAMP